MAVENILKIEQLTIDEKKQNLNLRLERSQNKQTINELMHFDKNVPHWFLSPWFPRSSKKEIYESLSEKIDSALHRLSGRSKITDINIAEAIKESGIEAAQYQVALKQVEALTAVGQGAGKQTIIVPAQALDAFGDAFKMLKGRL